jgi:hypothetical protein
LPDVKNFGLMTVYPMHKKPKKNMLNIKWIILIIGVLIFIIKKLRANK